MAILHGSWICKPRMSYFCLWGETWQVLSTEIPTTAVAPHPSAMDAKAVQDLARQRKLRLPSDLELDHSDTFALPSRGQRQPSRRRQSRDPDAFPVMSGDEEEIMDLASLTLQWWSVPTLRLTPTQSLAFLHAVPLGSWQARRTYLGDGLRFWAQIYRWSLALVARGKFLPSIDSEHSGWYPLLNSATDQQRLQHFTATLPSSCRAYPPQEVIWDNPKKTDDWIEAQTLVLNALSLLVDAQVRRELGTLPPLPPLHRDSLSLAWLQSLNQAAPSEMLPSDHQQRLGTLLSTWQLPVQDYLVTPQTQKFGGSRFRLCFILEAPTSGELAWGQLEWKLHFTLRSATEPEQRISAVEIWQNPVDEMTVGDQVVEHPQETLLKDLGLAAQIYQPLRESLDDPKPTRCLLDPIAAYEFLRARVQQLQNSGFDVILPPGLAPGAGEKRLGLHIQAKVKTKRGMRLSLQTPLTCDLELALGEQTLSAEEFEGLLAQQSPLVSINNEWLALQPADVRAAQAVLAPDTKDELTLTVEDALRLATGDMTLVAKLPVISFVPSGKLKDFIDTLTSRQSLKEIPPPDGIQGTLRPYQIRGFSWLAFLEQWSLGACLADDMGLGKTLQLITFLLHLKEVEQVTAPTLVVCPTSVLSNWEREIRKFAPTLKAWIHHGEKRKKGRPFATHAQKQDVVLTSYALVYRDTKTLDLVEWEGIVLDEAQNIKNVQSKQAQAVRQLKAGFRIALTGTPVENRLTELWSILDFLNPGFLGDRQFFQRRFAIPIEKYGDQDSVQALRSLVQPFILRRLKTDKSIIHDLPEKQEMTVYCRLSREQGELYQKLVDEALLKIEEAKGIQRHGLILSLLTHLKQVCNHPAHYAKAPKLETEHRSGKLRRLEAMLEEVIAEGDHALLFTQFTEWGKLLKPYLEQQLDTEVLFLHGGTKREQRQTMIDRFQTDEDGPKLFLLSLKAGGTGLNLTRANHVFHIDRWWNPAVENQATDRAFRIGQQRNVQVHKFVCTGTLEERINDIIESKKQLAEQTVDAGEQWLTEMDTDQLRHLLTLDVNTVMENEAEN
ncbi:MAG: DEAD/DEAH box helicase [Spirulina sp. SIO3F2]|nr:DEAD/DEAH box helicase [Spirulina sp. SIO3F2]